MTTRMRYAALSLALALFLPAAAGPAMAQAQTPPAQAGGGADPTRGATVEGITEYTLPNGLKVLLFPDESRPTITVNITYFVGSRHEAYGETGMAHLLEHLLFKGTPNHPNIPQELTERGAAPNGTTWFDRTNYYATFPATADNLEWAIRLEADRMINSFVRAEDLASEMTVVRNELEMGENSPFGVLMERVFSTAYLWHNYGKSTIGARADLENVPIERLQAFYRKYYQPDNAMLVVAGRFDPDAALALVAEHFGSIAAPDRSGANRIFDTYTREPTQDGERAVTLRRVGDTQVLIAAYHVPAGSHPDFAALDVLTHVLGNAPSGRLYKALVEPKHATTVGAFAFQLREPGVLLAFAELRREDSLDAAASRFAPTIESLVAEPPTGEEVERAKTALLRTIELNLNRSDRIGTQLSEWASMGDWRLLFIHRDRIRAVTPEDVQRVAAAYLKPANRTLGTFVPTDRPDRAEIPAAPPIEPLVAEYRGEADRAAGEAFDPSPANIEARTTRITLPNGFRLIMLPKQTRGGTVTASLTLRHGSEGALMNRATAGTLAGAMLMRGTEQRTRQQLRDEFDRLQSRVAVGGGATTASGTIETTRQNLPAVLRLVGEVLRSPAFDEHEFEQLKLERIAAVEERRSEPDAVAQLALSRHMDGDYPAGHPRYAGTFDEQLAALRATTLQDARQFYRDFYGAQAGEIAIVGDFDPAEIEAVVLAIFGDWTAAQPFERIATRHHDAPPASLQLETPDKANAFMFARLNLPIRDEHPDYPALVLANYMIGGGFLNSRLETRLRQKDGVSYGAGSIVNASPIDESGFFFAYAIYAPDNVGRVESAFREEMQRVVQDGFTAAEVDAAKQGYIQYAQLQRSQDATLAGALATATYFGRTMAWQTSFEERIGALSVDEINAALRRHVDPARITIVKAGDFAGRPSGN